MPRLDKFSIERLGAFLAFSGLIVLLAAYSFSFWQWHHSLPAETLSLLLVTKVITQVAKPDYTKLAQLFGSAKAEPVTTPGKESTSSLKLVASYVGGKGRSAAVIASSESNHKLYYPGRYAGARRRAGHGAGSTCADQA